MTQSARLSDPPYAIAALDNYPWLRAPIQAGLQRQHAHIQKHAVQFIGRHRLLQQIHTTLSTLNSGLITLEGVPGSGVTSVLAYLAATQPWSFWFTQQDIRQGATALHAQIIALHHLNVPLVAPAANQDPAALEHLLDEIAGQHPPDSPFIILIDGPMQTSQPDDPLALPLPTRLPEGVIIVYGCDRQPELSLTPSARIQLPQVLNNEIAHDQALFLHMHRCPKEWMLPIITAARGNFLYVHLVYALLKQGSLDINDLPAGLERLFSYWWLRLTPDEQGLALILAAAGEPMPLSLCAHLLGRDPLPLLARNASWITVMSPQIDQTDNSVQEEQSVEPAQPYLSLYHEAMRDFLARRRTSALTRTQDELVALVVSSANEGLQLPHWSDASSQYLLRQFARHAALGSAATRATALPLVTRREWIRTHERASGVLSNAARDLAWELRCAAETGPLLRIVRAGARAGTLAAMARYLSPDAAYAALTIAMEHSGREAALRRVLVLVEQMPDGLARAQVLRQLGEACYAAGMRNSAMRLLAQALDLEEQRIPRAWREQREQVQAALSAAVLQIGAIEDSLAIAARISHRERRGMAETHVMRWLLEHDRLEQAQSVACAIMHESLAAWAQAEVAVAQSRAGNRTACEELLASIDVETAVAWAQIELACDDALENEHAARARIAELSNSHQRDRGMTRLAHALALADKDGDALEVAGQISDVAVRVAALLDLRLTLEGLVAMLALEQATSAIDGLTGDARIPLMASLSAAHAALGRRERAVNIACQLADGEERDRALSRVAVALAGYGDIEQGQTIAFDIADDDERDWTLGELAQTLARSGHWQAAQELGRCIRAEELKARTLAELAIMRARHDDPLAALELVRHIHLPAERMRALTVMVPPLIAGGYVTHALDMAGVSSDGQSPTTTLLRPLEVSRYLAIVATALAVQGNLAQAESITSNITRPLDHARAFLGIAIAAVSSNPTRARRAIGVAFQAATVGREEAYRLLEKAAPLLTQLEGAALLMDIAAELDEIDTW